MVEEHVYLVEVRAERFSILVDCPKLLQGSELRTCERDTRPRRIDMVPNGRMRLHCVYSSENGCTCERCDTCGLLLFHLNGRSRQSSLFRQWQLYDRISQSCIIPGMTDGALTDDEGPPATRDVLL